MTATIAKEKPIIFTGHSVPAILDGRKTMTRRAVKNPDWHGCLTGDCPHDTQAECAVAMQGFCPYGKPGDRLWGRETWQKSGLGWGNGLPVGKVHYRATDNGEWKSYWGNWNPSIFMPRWASRITLEITEVRVERLHAITEEDAMADGGWSYANCPVHKNPVRSFADLWDKLNAKRGFSWESNPFCWVIAFRRLEAS